MSVKLNQIEILGRMDKEKIFVRARLILQNEISMSKPIIMTMNEKIVKEAVANNKDNLQKSLIHYIYGDLLEPINELAILAQHHLTGMNDADELKELRTRIDNIMKGI